MCVFTTSNGDMLKKSSVISNGLYVACNIDDSINAYRYFGKVRKVLKSNSSKPAAYKDAFHLSISQLISMSGCSKYDFRFSPCDQIVEVLLLRHLLASKNLRVTNFLESFNAYCRPTLTYFLEYFRSGFLL